MTTQSKNFTPWRADYLHGFLLIVGAIGTFILSCYIGFPGTGAVIGLIMFVIGTRRIGSGNRRSFGSDVERRASKQLAECLGRDWTCEFGVMMNAGGDIDVLAKHISGKKYIVEIKSFGGIVVQNGILVKANGGAIAKNIVAQCYQQKTWAKANGIVLWCPKAREIGRDWLKGINIVNGDAFAAAYVLNELVS